MKRQSGFTLVELMVAVVVVGILAAVVVPAYSNYVKRGKIAEATSNLGALRVSMEQYYLDNRTYLNGAACGAAMPAADNFTFTCAGTASTYTVTATGKGSMAGFVYTIDQNNAKVSTVTGVSGWSGNAACWVTKPGGAC